MEFIERDFPSPLSSCPPQPAAMSRLIKAISELLQSPQGSPRRGRNPEPFSRSEFKKLIQQELAPAKVRSRLERGKEAGKGSGGLGKVTPGPGDCPACGCGVAGVVGLFLGCWKGILGVIGRGFLGLLEGDF